MKKNYTNEIMKKLKETEEIINKRHSNDRKRELKALFDALVTNNFLFVPAMKAANLLGELKWFFDLVTHKGPWDIKNDESWKKTIGIYPIPIYGVKGKENETFIFLEKTVTREGLGNITYGYLGKAMNFPDILLYVGGGVAAHGQSFPEMVSNSLKDCKEVLKPPYYGDTKEDHECISRTS